MSSLARRVWASYAVSFDKLDHQLPIRRLDLGQVFQG